jgi:hypothetical protein
MSTSKLLVNDTIKIGLLDGHSGTTERNSCPRSTERQNKYNTGRRRTTWRQISSEMTKIWNDVRVWGSWSVQERTALERKNGDVGIERTMRNGRGQKDGISAQMWDRFMELYTG